MAAHLLKSLSSTQSPEARLFMETKAWAWERLPSWKVHPQPELPLRNRLRRKRLWGSSARSLWHSAYALSRAHESMAILTACDHLTEFSRLGCSREAAALAKPTPSSTNIAKGKRASV